MAKKKTDFSFSKILMGGSLVAIILAGVGAFSTDIYLASTQWMLVAAVLAAFGVYLRLEE